MIIFDHIQRARNLQRATKNFQDHDFLITHAWDQVVDRVMDIRRTFNAPLIIGTRGHTAVIQQLTSARKIAGPCTFADVQSEIIAAEPASHDLVLSTFDLHTINDLPGFLIQIRQILKPDGVFVAAMPGGETLYELRNALTAAELELRGGVSPRIFPFADKQQMGALMQRANFALPVVDSDIVRVEYSSLNRLLHDLRGMGEGNAIAARDRRPAPKKLFNAADHFYRENFTGTDGRLLASFEMIYLIGWGPSANQPQPLKPGTAKIRLADALETTEVGTGEPAKPKI